MISKKGLETASKVLTIAGFAVTIVSGFVADKLAKENLAEEVQKAVAALSTANDSVIAED